MNCNWRTSPAPCW